MELETLKQRITDSVKGKYTFEIQTLNTINWKLTRIVCYCPKHNHKWETAVTSPLYRGSGCPICAKEITASKKRTSIATIQDKLAKIEVEKNLVVTSQIQDIAIDIQRVQVKCKIHNIVWESTLGAVIRGNTNCRQCSSLGMSKKRMETKESLYQRLYALYNPQNIKFEFIGIYKGAKKTKIKCKCVICDYEWERVRNCNENFIKSCKTMRKFRIVLL